MAIASGKASVEAQEVKRFIGVCPVTVVAVNPTKAEFEKLFNTTLESDPVYVTDKEDKEGNPYKNIRISMVLKPVVEGMPLITMAMFLTSQKVHGAASGKYKVIDKFGRTGWLTEEQIKNKETGNLKLDSDYRIAFQGEEELTDFIKTFLKIESVEMWDNNTKSFIPNTKVKPEQCECRLDLDTFKKLSKGDFSEIREILAMQPTNKIKVCLGVRTNPEDGKQYQTVYTKAFCVYEAKNYNTINKRLTQDIDYATKNGRSMDTEYSILPVQEYKVTPTEFHQTENSTDNMPFSTDSSDPWA